MAETRYRIRNWDRFQHYKAKDGKPLKKTGMHWIRLYRTILDDPEIMTRPAEEFKFLVQLWLIATENPETGELPSVSKIAFRVRRSESDTSEMIKSLSRDFLDAVYTDSIPEKKREEKKREDHKEPCAEPLPRTAPPNGLFDAFVDNWNLIAKQAGIPKATATDSRRKTFATRIKNKQWLEKYIPALRLIPDIPFLCGKNDRNWTANIDWFLRPDSVVKTIDGQYGGPQKNANTTHGTTDIGIKPDELIDIGGGIMCPFGKFKATADAIKAKTGKPDAECGALAMAELRAEKQGKLA